MKVAKHPYRNSPPKLGGVARRRFISRDGVVPKPKRFGMGTTPPSLRSGTPPNLGGEFSIRMLRTIFLKMA
jgi:hypothetical protein